MRKTKIQDFQFVGSSGELLEIKRSPRVSRPLLDIVDKWRWHPLGSRSISSQEPTLFCLPNWKFLLSCLVVTHTPCVDISVKIDEGDAWVVQPWKKGDRLQQHLRPSLLVFQERHRWSSIEVFFRLWSATVRQVVRGGLQTVSEENTLQTLYQALDKWKIHPYILNNRVYVLNMILSSVIRHHRNSLELTSIHVCAKTVCWMIFDRKQEN